MIRIRAGEVYKAERVRSGSSRLGDWEMIIVKGEKGKEELTLWATNPGSGVHEGGEFRVVSIDGFTKKKVRYKDGKVCKDRAIKDGIEWRSDIDANVTVEHVGFDAAGFDFDDPPFMLDDENPFDELPL